MRENRTCGSEGGEAQSLPYPYRRDQAPLLGVAYLAKGWPAALTTRRARRSRSQVTVLR